MNRSHFFRMIKQRERIKTGIRLIVNTLKGKIIPRALPRIKKQKTKKAGDLISGEGVSELLCQFFYLISCHTKILNITF